MGIQGLLPFVKRASCRAHVQDFKGQTAAVDAYCWLHKGAYSCADKLAKGEPTNGYVMYMMKQINLLLNHGIKPIMVFDVCNLPSKAVTEAKRRESRQKNLKLAKELLREGRTREAHECFQRCIEVTSEMAFEVINACRQRNIDIIVAPYEADAQLAYLNRSGIAQFVITEDSDLLVFGCKAIVFKLDSNGGCVFVEQQKLHLALNIPPDKFSFDKFRNIAILSGCDYLPSLPGIGLSRANKFFNLTANTDIYNVLCRVPSYLNMPNLEVTQEYREKFMQASNTFLYQLVFDPVTLTLRPLNDYPEGMGPEDFPYAGKFVGHDRALQIALGNINVKTGETVDNFDPKTYKPPASSSSWSPKDNISTHPSVWSRSPVKRKLEAPTLLNPSRPSTGGKKVIVATPLFKKNTNTEPQETDLSEEDLCNIYSQPDKRKKIETKHEDEKECLEEMKDRGDESVSVSNGNCDKNLKMDGVSKSEGDNDLNVVESPKIRRSINPFAKQATSPKKDEMFNCHFSGIRKLSRMKKRILDSNTVVKSRYFSALDQISSDISEFKKLEQRSIEESPRKVCKGENEETTRPEDLSTSIDLSSMSPVHQASDTLAAAALNDHSEVLSQINEETPDQEEKLQVNTSTPSSSQLSVAVSIDNESFDLTPSSNTRESPKVSPLRDVTNDQPKEGDSKSPSPGNELIQERVIWTKNKCRTPGLARTKKIRIEPGKKQLSLTEMFGFKKDGKKL